VIIFLAIPQQQVMAPGSLQQGAIGAKSNRMTGTLTNVPPGERQQQRRHQLVQHGTAIVATKNMTQDAHLPILRETRSSRNEKQHAIGCESIHVKVDDGQLTKKHTAGVLRELGGQ